MIDFIELAARALVGDERYDVLPERASYIERKASLHEEWSDRQALRANIRSMFEAMREPTMEMVAAAVSFDPKTGFGTIHTEAYNVWQDMIDAALSQANVSERQS